MFSLYSLVISCYNRTVGINWIRMCLMFGKSKVVGKDPIYMNQRYIDEIGDRYTELLDLMSAWTKLYTDRCYNTDKIAVIESLLRNDIYDRIDQIIKDSNNREAVLSLLSDMVLEPV